MPQFGSDVAYFWVPLGQMVPPSTSPIQVDLDPPGWGPGFIPSPDPQLGRSSGDVSLVVLHKRSSEDRLAPLAPALQAMSDFVEQVGCPSPQRQGLLDGEATPAETEGCAAVMQAAITLPTKWDKTPEEERGNLMTAALDEVLQAARVALLGYAQVANRPAVLPSPSTLPALVPYFVCTQAGGLQPLAIGLLTNDIGADAHDLRVHGDGTSSFEFPATRSVFDAYFSLRNEAEVALRLYGHYWSALLNVAAAAEYLLTQTLILLQWERGDSPEDAANEFNARRGVNQVVERLKKILGGNWQTKTEPATWRSAVVDVRNRAVHAGVAVNREQAWRAFETLDPLRRHLGGLVFKQGRAFPFAAMVMTQSLSMVPGDSSADAGQRCELSSA